VYSRDGWFKPEQDGVNWYVYCGNNPLNAVDPSGLSWLGVGLGVLGMTVGIATAPLSTTVGVCVAVIGGIVGISEGVYDTIKTANEAKTLKIENTELKKSDLEKDKRIQELEAKLAKVDHLTGNNLDLMGTYTKTDLNEYKEKQTHVAALENIHKKYNPDDNATFSDISENGKVTRSEPANTDTIETSSGESKQK